MGCSHDKSDFEIYSRYYIGCLAKIHEKKMNSFISPALSEIVFIFVLYKDDFEKPWKGDTPLKKEAIFICTCPMKAFNHQLIF